MPQARATSCCVWPSILTASKTSRSHLSGAHGRRWRVFLVLVAGALLTGALGTEIFVVMAGLLRSQARLGERSARGGTDGFVHVCSGSQIGPTLVKENLGPNFDFVDWPWRNPFPGRPLRHRLSP